MKINNWMYYFQCSAFIPWRYRMKGIASLVYAAMKIPHFLFAIPKKNASLKNINNSTIDKCRLEISKRKTVINICCNAKLLFEKNNK